MFPEKIVCLIGESADICNRLGAADRVVAVSVFAPRSVEMGLPPISGFFGFKDRLCRSEFPAGRGHLDRFRFLPKS